MKDTLESGIGLLSLRLVAKDYPRIQILAMEDLLNGKGIDMPKFISGQTFKQAEKVKRKQGKQGELGI